MSTKPYKGKEKRLCEFCEKEFYEWPSSPKITCDRKCAMGRFRNLHSEVRFCEYCGKEFRVLLSQIRYGDAKRFCNTKCYHVGTRKGFKTAFGYRVFCIKDHPLASKSGNVPEHWLVMYENSKNKDLIADLRKQRWTIHHRNGKKDDNRIENLELRSPGKHPSGVSIQDMITILELFGYMITKNVSMSDMTYSKERL